MNDPRFEAHYHDPDYDPIPYLRVFDCDGCGYPIHEGDEYYEIDQNFLCPDCAKRHFQMCMRTAERSA